MNREALRSQNIVLQRRYERKYYAPVRAAIMIPIDRTIAAVERGGARSGLAYLHSTLSNTALTEVVQSLALDVGGRFARDQWSRFQAQARGAKKHFEFKGSFNGAAFLDPAPFLNLKAGPFSLNESWAAWIKRFLFDFIYTKVSFSVFQTTKESLIPVLNEAISKGWNVSDTVSALEEEGSQLSASQAARVVRTEITRASNAGTAAASKVFPFIQVKEWMSAHDDRVRGLSRSDHASHIGLDGTIVPEEQDFIDPRNGDHLSFPGDPRASAASTVNCRCTMAVVAKIGETGRLIPKKQIA